MDNPKNTKSSFVRIKPFFISGGIIVCLAAWLFDQLACSAGIKNEAVYLCNFLDLKGVVFGVVVCFINLHVWQLFMSGVITEDQSLAKQGGATLPLLGKLLITIGVFSVLFASEKEFVLSVVLGFTSVLFAGILQALIVHKICN